MKTFYLRRGARVAAAVMVIVASCLAFAGAASAQKRIWDGGAGPEAGPSEFPAQVALLYPGTNNSFCGGTVVAARYVLTAGHCVKDDPVKGVEQEPSAPEDLVVGYGSTSIKATTRIAVADVLVHPDFFGGPTSNDIAVLELATPVPSSIAPFPIVKPSTGNPWEKLDGTVFGWGAIDNNGTSTDTLRKLTYTVQTDKKCEETLEESEESDDFDENSMLCAADKSGTGYANTTPTEYAKRRVFCSGDSGGPLVMRDGAGGTLAVAGVVSWSSSPEEGACDNDTGFDVYGRIGNPGINAWIREQIDPAGGLVDPITEERPGRRPNNPSTTSSSSIVSRDLAAPTLGSLSLSNKTFAVDPKGAKEKAVAGAKKGTTFRYRLSEGARVVFLIEKAGKGRKSGKRCVKETKKNRKKGKCTAYSKVGAFAQSGRAGFNSKTFSGRIGSKKLSPGSYRATLTATDAAGNKSKVSSLMMKVVRR